MAVIVGILAGVLPACTLTQEVAPTDLNPTERGVFTDDGRFFVIGARPQGKPDAGWWIVEVTRGSANDHAVRDYVAGTLEGTADGTIGGEPIGDPCNFSGMASHGLLLYAACVASDRRASLLQVDTQARTVKAAYFTSCNFEPSATPCSNSTIYPNGMAVDDDGRIYASNTFAHIDLIGTNLTVNVQGSHVITQIVVDPSASTGNSLAFRYHDWLTTDILTDGIAPNGIQIENGVLYYAAGANINKATIQSDGTAGPLRVHYRGPALSYIDDFGIRDGRMAVARTLPPGIVALDRSPITGLAREIGVYPMPLDAVPSSVAYQDDVPAGGSVFSVGSIAITSYFGGGVYTLAPAR